MRVMQRIGRQLLLILVFVSGSAGTAAFAAESWIVQAQGRAVALDDGDSFDLRIPGRGRLSIRLHAVDAPQTVQPVGKRARQALIDAIADRHASARTRGRNCRPGRVLLRRANAPPLPPARHADAAWCQGLTGAGTQ